MTPTGAEAYASISVLNSATIMSFVEGVPAMGCPFCIKIDVIRQDFGKKCNFLKNNLKNACTIQIKNLSLQYQIKTTHKFHTLTPHHYERNNLHQRNTSNKRVQAYV